MKKLITLTARHSLVIIADTYEENFRQPISKWPASVAKRTLKSLIEAGVVAPLGCGFIKVTELGYQVLAEAGFQYGTGE